MLRFALSLTLLTAGLASAQIRSVVVSGGGQTYAALSTAAAWQSVELPIGAVSGLDRSSLSVSAPGLGLKLLGTTVMNGGQTLKLSLDVQQGGGFRSGPTTLTLKDAAGHSVTFEVAVY